MTRYGEILFESDTIVLRFNDGSNAGSNNAGLNRIVRTTERRRTSLERVAGVFDTGTVTRRTLGC